MNSAQPDDWKTTPMPAEHAIIQLDRHFSSEEMERIRLGVVPEQMEDKWFVYWKEDSLYLHRSWTGYCIFVVRFEVAAGGATMLQALANRDAGQYGSTDGAGDREMISYLIDILLLHRPGRFPASEPASETQSLKTWSLIGRAMLGEYPKRKE